MAKISLIRLPESTAAEVQKIADRKGLPFATTIRELICEIVNGKEETKKKHEIASGSPEPVQRFYCP